jgi:hypothetical protein
MDGGLVTKEFADFLKELDWDKAWCNKYNSFL